MTSLSPANLTSHQMLSVSDNSVGPFTVDNNNGANYNQNPTMLPSSKILIPPHASAGTKSNCAAAAGKFVSYKALAGGNKISRKSNMKGGKKLSLEPANCKGEVNHRHHALGTYDNGPVPRPLEIKGGKRRRHTMKDHVRCIKNIRNILVNTRDITKNILANIKNILVNTRDTLVVIIAV